MTPKTSLSTSRRGWNRSIRPGRAVASLLLLLLGLAAPAARAQTEVFNPVVPQLESEPLFSLDTPVGPFEYRIGRGIHFGKTGLNVGGFTTLEFERLEGEAGEFAVDSVNFLILLQPWDFVRGFAELELGDLFTWRTNEGDPDSSPNLRAERLFGDLILGNPFVARFGKFQTPVGRWNLVPAEPFQWTPAEPVVVETAFDEHITGGALLGTLYPGEGSLDYWIYGQFLDALDPSNDPEPTHRSVGGRLQYDQSFGDWSLGASFLASELNDDWSYLGSLDAVLQLGPAELSSEFYFQRGDIEDRDLWDVYVQGVVEVLPEWLPGFYLVGRYEHFDPHHWSEESNIGDVGFAWLPRHWLQLKAVYRFTDEQSDEVRRGVKAAVSVIF